MAHEVQGGVVKVIELVGSSTHSFSDAVRNAVRTASQTVRHIQGVDVLASSAQVDENGNLTNYKVNCKLAFLVDTGKVGDETANGQQARQESTSGTAPSMVTDPASLGGGQAPFGSPPPAGGGTSPTGPT
jgi:flavin-binding protein dodecin